MLKQHNRYIRRNVMIFMALQGIEYARHYRQFYNTDLYSIHENKTLVHIIRDHIGEKFFHQPFTIGDFGCGGGYPDVIWQHLGKFATRYEGYDLSPEMLLIAKETYLKEIQQGQMMFVQGDIREVISSLPDRHYDLVTSFHGVLSCLPPEDVPETVMQLGRITKKYAVLGFLSRYALNRAPAYPKAFLHQDRGLENAPDHQVYAYTLKKATSFVKKSGLKVIAVPGMNIVGGLPHVHKEFVHRQREVEQLHDQEKVIARCALEKDILDVLRWDQVVGQEYPEFGHDLIVIAKR